MQQLRYLSLSDANFGGRIPESLGNLTNLRFLDLSQPEYLQIFEASDINWISGIQSLEHLDMSNAFIGKAHKLFQVLNTLPSLSSIYFDDCGIGKFLVPHLNITNAPKVRVLSLAGNQLEVPALNALQNLTSLQHLDLSWNHLDSVPFLFHKSENLKYLDLSNNWLNGSIPYAFRNFTSIEFLFLGGNRFTSIPSWFRDFEKLVALDLSFNELNGPVPQAFQNLTSIELLDLSANNLTSVPSWFIELKRLLDLDLSRNNLRSEESSLSEILKNMCQLQSLNFSTNNLGGELLGSYELSTCIKYDLKFMDMSHNEFNEHLPTWLGRLDNLEELNLEGNSFLGSIPSTFENLSKLKQLMLSNNKLEGDLPSMNIVNLTHLHLSNNWFNCTIPESLGQLVNLRHLDLSRNKLHGSIPSSFDQLVNLSELDVSSNYLDGTFSMGKNWSSNMPYLWYLNLSSNQISDSLPKHIGHVMPNLQLLILGNNRINGSIPLSLCQTNLFNLDLSKNRLSSIIPNCWKDDNVHWGEINLSFNNLSGVFPSSFGNLYTLLWLHLNNNSLQGELPMSVRYLKQLLILNLGENQFSGSIPSWTANTFPSLQVLRLSRNMLSGNIPQELCELSALKILDLSHNLQGSIPLCIGNLQGMTLHQSSPDQYSGEVVSFMAVAKAPAKAWSKEDVKQVMKGRELDYTKNLVLVVNLDLSYNSLVGVIPKEITLLSRLHGLRLSNNRLKGGIPKTIGNMISLESFDVSFNQLSGTIPSEMPTLTFLSLLNLAFNNFSGPIPTSNQFLTYNSSSYAGNLYLCGFPLLNSCPVDNSHQDHGNRGFEDEDGVADKLEKWWFYFVIAAGFATGFWGFFGVLFFKKSWKHAYFRWVENLANTIYVEVAIKMAHLKEWIVRNNVHG